MTESTETEERRLWRMLIDSYRENGLMATVKALYEVALIAMAVAILYLPYLLYKLGVRLGVVRDEEQEVVERMMGADRNE